MDVTLVRNGYNLERRKMYLENPRHNLRSSVDFLWKESLGESPNSLSQKKQVSTQLTAMQYTKAIDKRLEEELKLNKSSFRVMPAQPADYQPKKKLFYDSLNKQIDFQNGLKKSGYDSPIRERPVQKKSQSLSKSVFGYDINNDPHKQQSYLSKILGDKLSPYLKRQTQNPKHQSFTINHPISLKY